MNNLCIELDPEEARQLSWLLNRALNSLEPHKWPPIASVLIENVEAFAAKTLPNPMEQPWKKW